MHSRIVRYEYSGDAQELTQRAEDGVLPILEAQPGFRAYSLFESECEIISLSTFDTREQAEAANAAIADWVAENMQDDIKLVEARFGEVLFSTLLPVGTKAGTGA